MGLLRPPLHPDLISSAASTLVSCLAQQVNSFSPELGETSSAVASCKILSLQQALHNQMITAVQEINNLIEPVASAARAEASQLGHKVTEGQGWGAGDQPPNVCQVVCTMRRGSG